MKIATILYNADYIHEFYPNYRSGRDAYVCTKPKAMCTAIMHTDTHNAAIYLKFLLKSLEKTHVRPQQILPHHVEV